MNENIFCEERMVTSKNSLTYLEHWSCYRKFMIQNFWNDILFEHVIVNYSSKTK